MSVASEYVALSDFYEIAGFCACFPVILPDVEILNQKRPFHGIADRSKTLRVDKLRDLNRCSPYPAGRRVGQNGLIDLKTSTVL